MTSLTEFLLARIADDEAAAIVQRDGLESLSFGMGALSSWLVAVDANSIPTTSIDYTRVLAECRVKRRVVDRLQHTAPDHWAYDTLLDIAAVYSDHPDYDEAWRP